ncbi:hypothetical protein AX16_002329 [Volvariella volvacea WC 439]|nr:hypothetical protein AX16_002329 [Volvariella volvacea WC 439]
MFLFKEMKMSSSDPSDRILTLTNKHVASTDTKVNYEFNRTNPQHILVCGDRRLARAVTEIEDAVRLARTVADLEAKLGTPKENRTALRHMKNALEEKNEDNTTLQTFFAEVNAVRDRILIPYLFTDYLLFNSFSLSFS